jgi:replication factor C small subunit
MYSIWTEKYRPKQFSEVVGQKNIVNTISSFVKSKQLPHLLFSGPAGSGKSTIALIIAKELFGDSWKQNFLETNASDERGIDTIRTKVKDFARTKSIGNVPYKIIFLDEADSLTPEAQNALRRTIENYSKGCRFILSCNYSGRIIDPIQSRCAVFRFSTVNDEEIKKRLKLLIDKEGLTVDPEAMNAICKLSEGDLRKSINILQAAAINTLNINEKTIYDVAAVAQPSEIKNMLEIAIDGNFTGARKILNELLLKHGIAGEDIIKQIANQIHDLDIPEKRKVELIEKIGEYEYRLRLGTNELIQLEALLAQFTIK